MENILFLKIVFVMLFYKCWKILIWVLDVSKYAMNCFVQDIFLSIDDVLSFSASFLFAYKKKTKTLKTNTCMLTVSSMSPMATEIYGKGLSADFQGHQYSLFLICFLSFCWFWTLSELFYKNIATDVQFHFLIIENAKD